MKVYVAYTGFDYEGTDESSIRVFSTLEKAEDYIKALKIYYKTIHMNYGIDEHIIDIIEV